MASNIAAIPQLPWLVVTDGTPIAQTTRASQVPWLVVVDGGLNNPRSSQDPLLVVYSTGARANYKMRAWPFFLDGNWYYVLHLGLEGTWVYCQNTDTWAQWSTQGFPTWNAEQGTVWNSRIIAGDNQDPVIMEVSPLVQLDDDFRPIVRTVTGFVPASARQTVTVDSLYITASVGYPVSLQPLVSVSYSDDYGQTFVPLTNFDVTILAGDYTQEIAFRSLGSFHAPGRVFKVTDNGAAVRIDRAWINLRP